MMCNNNFWEIFIDVGWISICNIFSVHFYMKFVYNVASLLIQMYITSYSILMGFYICELKWDFSLIKSWNKKNFFLQTLYLWHS